FLERVASTWEPNRPPFAVLKVQPDWPPIGRMRRAPPFLMAIRSILRARRASIGGQSGWTSPSYTGRGKRAHGAMNKEHHVCARRRASEAAGPVGLVDDRTRES